MAGSSSDREESIQTALAHVELGVYRSLRQASIANRLPRSTIGHRRAGRKPRAQIHVKSARLRSDQEDTLLRFIRDLQLQYTPINHTQIAVVAQHLADENRPGQTLGKN
jgi:hypothetical protein